MLVDYLGGNEHAPEQKPEQRKLSDPEEVRHGVLFVTTSGAVMRARHYPRLAGM